MWKGDNVKFFGIVLNFKILIELIIIKIFHMVKKTLLEKSLNRLNRA